MELVTGLHLLVVLWIIAVVYSSTKLKINVSNCDVPQKTVIDDSWNNKTITSHCGCTIKSNFSGKLILASRDSCSPVFKVFDDNETLIRTLCENNIASFQTNVAKGDHFKLVFVNDSLIQSGNHGGIVNIYAEKHTGNGLFSITCGTASESIGITTGPTLSIGTVAEPDTYDHNLNASKSEFPYVHAVAAGSIVAVFVLIIISFCIRRKNRAQNTSKEERKEDRTFDNATDGIERPENAHSTAQQQLPDNPLYQSYQENDDGGYSTCRNENIGHTEQLPNNPLYHSYQANGNKEDSKQNNGKDAGTLPLEDSNAVYAQPNKLAKASNSNQDDSNESQNENVYAQVNKTKET
uniref:Uncharacterized protein LOC111104161 isoform X2 n=1 Tax=Crassostrea virginica TaxID=6565 RepID=A0A8B8ATX2_CRAVI|nr:uncharacterized protein LOC111104161 isoform X2 [Crassostrea virginica]